MKKKLLAAMFVLGALPMLAAVKPIDPAQSTLMIHVGKSGLLSAAGHEHLVKAPIAEGILNDASPAEVSFRVEAVSLTVQPEEHQSEVQHSMQEKVLESARFPEIRFASQSVRVVGNGQWDVTGTLTLHGQSRAIPVKVQMVDGAYIGSTTIKQTDFGIEPVSAAGGTVKVKNELTMDFVVKTK